MSLLTIQNNNSGGGGGDDVGVGDNSSKNGNHFAAQRIVPKCLISATAVKTHFYDAILNSRNYSTFCCNHFTDFCVDFFLSEYMCVANGESNKEFVMASHSNFSTTSNSFLYHFNDRHIFVLTHYLQIEHFVLLF